MISGRGQDGVLGFSVPKSMGKLLVVIDDAWMDFVTNDGWMDGVMDFVAFLLN